MSVSIGNITLYMGPTTLGAPDDLEPVIVDFIDKAAKTLVVAVQELESVAIANALLRAKARKVNVRVILESLYLTEAKPVADPWSLKGEFMENRRILDALLAGALEVRMDLNPATFHQKFMVRDSAGAKAAVLTGSANFTPTDMGDPNAIGRNLNHVVVIEGKRVAETYQQEFEELWTGTFGELQERRDPKPKEVRVSEVRVKVLFAPDHSPEMEIMKQMMKAKSRVDFAMFTFTYSSGINDAMCVLDRSGKPVRGILDRGQGNQKWAATVPLKTGGAEIYLVKQNAPVRKLHHKLMVIDEQLIIAGSFNYTEPANMLNDENIVVIGDLEELAANTAAIKNQKTLATYALAEIDRMISVYGAPA